MSKPETIQQLRRDITRRPEQQHPGRLWENKGRAQPSLVAMNGSPDGNRRVGLDGVKNSAEEQRDWKQNSGGKARQFTS